MITGDIKNRIDSIWDTYWVGGITNPMSVLEQMTYLFFMKMLDDAQIKNSAYKQQMAQGCAYNALTIVNLKKMFFALPPIDLQNLFASKIEAIEHQKEFIKQSIREGG